MNRPFRPTPLAAALATALLLHGCGGSGDDDGAAPPVAETPGPTVTLSGVVLDGVLRSAKVCVDLDDDRVCDAGEPQATTDANGAWSIANVRESDAAAHPVLAEATATTTVDADYGPVVDPFTLMAPAGQHAVVSPFTTLVQSEVDGGRAVNVVQAEDSLLTNLVGVAGDVGGLTLQSNYLPVSGEAATLAARRARMYGLAQVLTRGFAETKKANLTGTAATAALGQAATGSLQIVLSQVAGPLPLADRDVLFNAHRESLVPTAANLADVAAANAKTVAAPIEGAWIRTIVIGAATKRELYLFAGDGTFVHQTIEPEVPAATSTAFDNGFGYRYGRYSLAGGTLTTSLIEAAEASGPGNGALGNVTVSGNTLTADGGIVLERVASATSPLVGGWIRPNGSNEPEYLVLLADGTYVHGTFYYQNDPQTGTASFFQTAKVAGLRKGSYALDAPGSSVVNFGATTVAFNGNLAIPSNPGVGTLQPDGSLSLTGLRLVKLGTPAGAKAISGFSESTRARLWSGRYFSRTVSVAGVNRLQYVYVRGPNDVLTFLQAPVASDATIPCGSTAATQSPIVDFTSVAPADGKLKHFVVGTGTAASAGYAQRRLLVGQPGAGNFVTYTPIARPTNATARCAVPL